MAVTSFSVKLICIISVNPIVYGLVNPVFRKAYKNTVTRLCIQLSFNKTPVKQTVTRSENINSKSTSSLDELSEPRRRGNSVNI